MSGAHWEDGARLQEYLSSPCRERGRLNHVRCCARCQLAVRRARLARLAAGEPEGDLAGEHLSPDRLRAFALERLNDRQTRRAWDHLCHCRRCLESFRREDRRLGELPGAGS